MDSLISIHHQSKNSIKMNKLLIMYSCVLLGSTAVANDQQSTKVPVVETKTESLSTFENNFTVLQINAEIKDATSKLYAMYTSGSFELNLSEIEFVEEESVDDLGFDTSDYLPEGFNPYETYFDLNSIIYIEDETDLNPLVNTSEHLPEGFDAYTDIVDVHSVNYIEEENNDLGFNTEDYLPEGFSPFEAYIDLNSIPYIEEDFELNLGLDSEYLLPEGFDPYEGSVEVASINYMEDENIDLGFDASVHLPEGFDPHARANR